MDELHELAVALSAFAGFDFAVHETNVLGQLVAAIRPSGLERGRGFSIVPKMGLRHVTASVELDEFARPILETIFARFSEAKEVLCNQVEAIVGSSSCVYFIGADEVESLAQAPAEIWQNFAFELKTAIELTQSRGQQLESVAVKALAVALVLIPIERSESLLVDNEINFPEGSATKVLVNRYERDPRNRAAAIAIHGWTCKVCGFDFERTYGDIGSGYIEVHHLVPLSSLGESYQVSPANDLVPLCSNCHSMVHRRTPPFTPAELSTIVLKMVEDE